MHACQLFSALFTHVPDKAHRKAIIIEKQENQSQLKKQCDLQKEPTELPFAEDEAPGTQPPAPTGSTESGATPSKYSPCTATRTSWP